MSLPKKHFEFLWQVFTFSTSSGEPVSFLGNNRCSSINTNSPIITSQTINGRRARHSFFIFCNRVKGKKKMNEQLMNL